MSFKKELANAILLNMPDVHFHTEGFDEALTSIINLVDKEVIGEDETFDKAEKKYLTRSERTIVTRNVLKAEMREKIHAKTL